MESHPQPHQFTCVGCGELILDQYVLRVAPDMEWHVRCLRCTDCQQLLDENCTCFVRQGKVYCKPDYVRLFGTRCAKCQTSFARDDLVMKAKSHIFHVDCFRCAICARQLVSGDEFAVREDARLLCKADHEAAYVTNNNAVDSVIDDVIVSCASNNNNDVDTKTGSDSSSSRSETASPSLVHCASSRTYPDSHPRGSSVNHGTVSSCRGGGGRCGGRAGGGHRGSEAKTTRIRTVLNEKQLHTLRTCYSANSRPDALMKEQLVEMTGLSPRVIRVWFQNKRCKDKKRSLALKQLHQRQQSKDDNFASSWIVLKGVPLIATSPVRHELPHNMQPTPVEVHKYSAPWNDFGSPTSPDMDDVPSPPPPTVVGGLPCAEALPLSLLDHPGVTAGAHAMTALSSCESLADSFDDDTVVSFDDLSEVVSSRYVASAPPPITDQQPTSDFNAALDTRF